VDPTVVRALLALRGPCAGGIQMPANGFHPIDRYRGLEPRPDSRSRKGLLGAGPNLGRAQLVATNPAPDSVRAFIGLY
jgi:hypothetical protein